MTIVFAHCLHVLGGIKPLAHLIHEFLLEVRFRWENSQTLPGLPPGVPDQGYSLFHQKLQMINCCIERKIARDTAKDCQNQQSLEQNMEEDDQENDDTSDEDIFFDCDEEDNQPESSIPIWSKEPVGRSKKLKQKLLQHDEFMYVPICQDPSPLTEDMLGMHGFT